jgi:type VI secretion system secreted protein Hcp
MNRTPGRPGFGFRVVRALLAAAFAAAAAAPAAADDIFLRMDPVRGESVDARHRGEIDILSYAQSMAGPFAHGTTSSGAGAGKTVCGPVTLMKYVDQASPDLILSAANGRHYPKAVITFRKSGQAAFEYYKVTLEDVVVTEVEQSDSKISFPNPATPRAMEKVSLLGRTFAFEYVAQTQTGAAGAQPKAGWDCVANAKR